MSDTTQSTTELFDASSEAETNSINTSEVEGDSRDTKQGEQEKKDATVANQEKMLDSWTGKIISGKASLDELPPAMAWAKSLLAERLGKYQQSQDIDALVDARLRKIREEESINTQKSQFEKMRDDLNKKGLDSEDQALIQTKFNSLLAKGLGNVAALEEAIEFYEVVSKSTDSFKREQLKKMAIPVGNATQPEPSVEDPDFVSKGDSTSRVAAYEKLLAKGGYSNNRGPRK